MSLVTSSLSVPSAPAEASPSDGPLFGPTVRLRLFATVLMVPAVAVWIKMLLPLPVVSTRYALPVWGLAALFFITERWPIAVGVRRSTPPVGMSAAPLVLGLFFAPSWAIIAGYLVGAVAAAISRGDLRHPDTTFSIAQFCFFSALATLTFHATVGTVEPGQLGTSAYGAVLAVGLVLMLTSLTNLVRARPQRRRRPGRPGAPDHGAGRRRHRGGGVVRAHRRRDAAVRSQGGRARRDLRGGSAGRLPRAARRAP